jgi:hypothetical protein
MMSGLKMRALTLGGAAVQRKRGGKVAAVAGEPGRDRGRWQASG